MCNDDDSENLSVNINVQLIWAYPQTADLQPTIPTHFQLIVRRFEIQGV